MVLPSIVAIHGLGGHWKETWTTDNGTFWLEDPLPHDLPNAHILSYGYDAHPYGWTFASQQGI